MPVLAPSRRGGKRLAKKAKRKQEALHDLVQICVLLLVVVLICTFWNVSDSLADPELETDISGFGQQSSQSQFIASYTRAKEQESSLTPRSNLSVDTSTFYQSAKDAGMTYNSSGSVTGTGTGLTVFLNSPTRPIEDGSFISHTIPMMEMQVSDMANAEAAISGVMENDIHGKAVSSLTGTRVFGVESDVSWDYYGGALGPALVDNTFYEAGMWKSGSPGGNYWAHTKDEYPEVKAANKLNSVSRPYVVNLMFVNEADVERYLSGDSSVPVYYVEYMIVDAKGHSAPWGLGQTWVSFDGTKHTFSYPSATAAYDRSREWVYDQDTSEADRESTGAFWSRVIDNASKKSEQLLALPTLKNSGLTNIKFDTFPSYTYSWIEVTPNAGSSSMSNWRNSLGFSLTFVGVLVF